MGRGRITFIFPSSSTRLIVRPNISRSRSTSGPTRHSCGAYSKQLSILLGSTRILPTEPAISQTYQTRRIADLKNTHSGRNHGVGGAGKINPAPGIPQLSRLAFRFLHALLTIYGSLDLRLLSTTHTYPFERRTGRDDWDDINALLTDRAQPEAFPPS